MDAGMKVCLACFTGVLCLSGINIYANEQILEKNVMKNANSSIHCATEAIDVENFTQKLFTELEANDYVLQLDKGGYLYSTSKDIEELKHEFETSNKGVELNKVTVLQAKENLQMDLNNALSKEEGMKSE